MANVNTSLELKYKTLLSADGVSLSIVETTGVYSNTNITGYGTTNPVVGDVTGVELEIAANDSTYVYDLSSTEIDLTVWPDNSSDEIVVIESEDIGQETGSQITDQVLTLTFSYTGTFNAVSFTAETVLYVGVAPALECCYEKLLNLIDAHDCGCDDADLYYTKAVKLRATIDAFYNAAACGDVDVAVELLSQGNFICTECGCGC